MSTCTCLKGWPADNFDQALLKYDRAQMGPTTMVPQRRRLTKCTTKEKARKVAKMRRYIRDCLARGSKEKARASSFGTMSPKGKEKNRMMKCKTTVF